MRNTAMAVLAVVGVLALGQQALGATQISGVTVGTWAQLTDPAGEDVRYIEALPGQDVLFWRRTSDNALRRAAFTYAGGAVTLGTAATATGLTSGDHASILSNGGNNLEGYFQPVPNPSNPGQNHAVSTDGGLTWANETLVPYPFPTPPGVGVSNDSGTTGGGGILEVGGQRRIYGQNNFGDIALWATTAGSAGSLTAQGRLLIKGVSGTAPSGAYSFQNQSPSGDALLLPNGQVIYLYTDGEGTEATGAVGAMLLNSDGFTFADVRDNFVNRIDVAGAGMSTLDEMTVSHVSVSGNQVDFLLFLDGKYSGSDRNIFYAPVSVTFDTQVPEPATMALLTLGGTAMLLRRRRK